MSWSKNVYPWYLLQQNGKGECILTETIVTWNTEEMKLQKLLENSVQRIYKNMKDILTLARESKNLELFCK